MNTASIILNAVGNSDIPRFLLQTAASPFLKTGISSSDFRSRGVLFFSQSVRSNPADRSRIESPMALRSSGGRLSMPPALSFHRFFTACAIFCSVGGGWDLKQREGCCFSPGFLRVAA